MPLFDLDSPWFQYGRALANKVADVAMSRYDPGIGASGGHGTLTAPPPVELSAYQPPEYSSSASQMPWTPAPEPAPPAFNPITFDQPNAYQPMQAESMAAPDWNQGNWLPNPEPNVLPGPTAQPDFARAEEGTLTAPFLQHADDVPGSPWGRLAQSVLRAPSEILSPLSFGLIDAPYPRHNIPVTGGPVGGSPSGGFGGPALADSISSLTGTSVPDGPMGVAGFALRTLTDPYNFVGGPRSSVRPTTVAGAVPQSADDLERLMQQSLDMAKANPTKAREVFSAEGQQVGEEIGQAQQAKSQFYRDTGHVTKRATELSKRMDEPPTAGIVADTLPRDGAESVIKSVGAAGLGGTLQGTAAELDSDPDSNFGESFVKGALSGLASQAGIRTRMNVAEEATETKAPRTILDNLLAIPNASKRIQTSGDVMGAQFRQGLPTLAIDPAVWGRSSRRALRAYFEDPAASGVMEEIGKLPRFADSDVRRALMVTRPDGTKDAVVVDSMRKVLGIGDDFATPGFERINDSLVSRIADSYPLVDRSEKSMRAALVGTATELRNQMIDSAQRAGISDPDWYKHYGDIAKVAIAYGDVPKSLKAMSDNFYSLRNIAARFQTLTQPFTKPGPILAIQDRAAKTQGIFSASPRGVAIRHAARFGAAELGNLRFLAAAGKFSGAFEVGYDPLGPGFGRLTSTDKKGDDYSLDLLGGYGSMIKAIARSGAAATDMAQGKEARFDPMAEWLQFSRYKLAGMPAAIVDTGIANSFLGDNPELRSPFEKDLLNPETWKGGKWAEWFVPFFAGDTIQALVQGDVDPTPGGLLKEAGLLLGQWAGAPLSRFPATATDQIDIALRRVPESMRTDIEGNVHDRWSDLSAAQKNAISEQFPEVAEAEAKRNEASTSPLSPALDARAKEMEAAFTTFQQTGSGVNYRKALTAASDKARILIEAETGGKDAPARTPDQKLMQKFYTEVADVAGDDYELRDRLEQQFRSTLSPAAQTALDANLQTSSDPNYAKLKAARTYLESAYWNVGDEAYTRLAATAAPGSIVTQYPTYNDLSKAAADRTNPNAVVAQKLKASVDSKLGDVKALARRNDPKADALLYIYGYNDGVITPQAQAMVVAWATENGVNLATPPMKR